ncbi:hypothetical protein FCN77_15800 [Arthrobacter sp. 24S4-2]|nr:hypothetical protein FCN77_15800 [Arthrobacter sp. 24S4-2]
MRGRPLRCLSTAPAPRYHLTYRRRTRQRRAPASAAHCCCDGLTRPVLLVRVPAPQGPKVLPEAHR